jgi:hypothetical protein
LSKHFDALSVSDVRADFEMTFVDLLLKSSALACIIHDDFEKASKVFPENQSGDLLKKQSVF